MNWPGRGERVALAAMVIVLAARGEDFSIQFASPVASGTYQMKRSAFVFRTVGCAAGTAHEVSAAAEGRVDGNRRSIPLKVAPASAANVFGIFREWPESGLWIVSIKARCAEKTAGALVVTDAKGIVREASKTLDHAATEAEIEKSLSVGKKVESRND